MSRVVAADPILVADAHWRERGWDIGEHFAASLSIYRTDEVNRHTAIASALNPHGLTQSRHEALAVLFFSNAGEMPLVKLSERLLVHPTSVTSAIDALERLGFAQRVAHPTDRRTTLARITATGRRAMEQTCESAAARKFGLGSLDGRQASSLFDLLAKVRADTGDITRVNGQDANGPSATIVEDPVLVADRHWASHGWVDGPYFRTAFSIYRTADILRRVNDIALRPHLLTHARHEALAVLYFSRHGEMMMSELGKRLLVHPTTVTSTVDALGRLGMVTRVRHPDDGRVTLARITAHGRDAIEASNTAMTETRFGLAALTDAQAKSITDILSGVRISS